jgi:rhombotail lipoprotein
MALVSYDQVANSGDMKIRSLAYLTIVGAFIVQGSQHEVSTLVDLAVVDPKTHSLVLRAGGTDNRHNTSTLVDADREARGLANDSFGRATNDMIEHFDAALLHYETEVHEGTARVRIVSRNSGGGRGGAGSFDVLGALLLLAVPTLRAARARGVRPA